MSEERKFYTIRKTTPNRLIFTVASFEDPNKKITIDLTRLRPERRIAKEFAFGLLTDPSLLDLFRSKSFTIIEGKDFLTAATEAGAYFEDDELNELVTKPANDPTNDILAAFGKASLQNKYDELEKKYSREVLLDVAAKYANTLPMSTLRFLETKLKVQLIEDVVEADATK